MPNPIIYDYVNLEITPGKAPPVVHVSEYDTGRNIVVYLYNDDGQAYTKSSNLQIKVEGTIGDYGFSEDAFWSDDADNAIVFTLTESMTAIHGRVWTKIKLIDTANNLQLSSGAFWLDVDRAGVEADTVISAKGFEKQITDAVNDRVDEKLASSIPIDVVIDATKEWLDDNPEVVYDPDAIVGLVGDVNRLKKESPVVVDTYADLLTSTADYVLVRDMSDSIYGFEGPCEFYKSNLVWESGTKTHLSSFAHRTSDGAVMLACPDQIPTPPPNAPISALGDCIASWVRPQTWSGHESETLTYGAKGLFYATANTYTQWNSERTYGIGEFFEHNGVVYRTTQSVSGVEPPNNTYYESYLSKNLIDCSGFVSAIIQGITFQNSRYILGVNAENIRGGYAGSNYMTEATYETGFNHGGMVTSQMVEWFAEQRRLFRLRTDDNDQNNQDAIDQLRFGDVLFSGDPNVAKYDNYAYHIDHCTLVLKVYNDGHILVAQGGGRGTGYDGATGNFLKSSDFNGHTPTCKLSIIDMRGMIGDNKTYRVFARPNYGGLEAYRKTVPITVNNEIGNNNRIARIYCLDNLYRGESYTLILKGNLPDGDNYVLSAKLWNSGSSTGYGTVIDLPEVDFSDGVAVIPFVYPMSFNEKANELAIFATPKSEAEAQTFEIIEAAIVRGFSDSAEMTKAITVPNDTTVSGLLDELKTQVVDVIPSFESRRGRVQAGGQTCDWKVIRKATNTRYLIAIIGSGGSGIVRECINGTANDTSYTAANPVPLYYVF